MIPKDFWKRGSIHSFHCYAGKKLVGRSDSIVHAPHLCRTLWVGRNRPEPVLTHQVNVMEGDEYRKIRFGYQILRKL